MLTCGCPDVVDDDEDDDDEDDGARLGAVAATETPATTGALAGAGSGAGGTDAAVLLGHIWPGIAARLLSRPALWRR